MEYQKIINFLDNTLNQLSNLGQKIGLKEVIIHLGRKPTIVKLNLRLQCQVQVYVIIVMHTFLLIELLHSETLEHQQPQVIGRKK